MPGMRILRTDDFTALPWKNGLGVSHVIASDPPGEGYDTVLWQVGATAITADCPFSSLPGTDRQFTLLEGSGVELKCESPADGVNLTRVVDTLFVPFAFRGDWRTHCRLLGGPVRVLNVMTRRGRATAAMRIQRWTGGLFCEQHPGETLLAVVLTGTARVAGVPEGLRADETVLLQSPHGEQCEIASPGAVARIAIVRIRAA